MPGNSVKSKSIKWFPFEKLPLIKFLSMGLSHLFRFIEPVAIFKHLNHANICPIVKNRNRP